MGCKASNYILVSVLVCESFTLTMWDVKKIKFKSVSIISSFYLNYVGCKVIINNNEKNGVSNVLP